MKPLGGRWLSSHCTSRLSFRDRWTMLMDRPGSCPNSRGMIPAISRCDAVCGDDLVGGAAGDFGHAVELPGEAAGAGGGRAQFHDQVTDLRLRHGGADAIPSRPALAG